MKIMIAAGILVFSARIAGGAYIVDLDGGDRMTVDSYWVDGDRAHLMRGGVDMSVPKSRVRSVKAVSDPEDSAASARPAPAPQAAAPTQAASAGRPTREDLEARQRGIEKHLLRVQREKFEAEARGDDPRTLKRLAREFQRTQRRRVEGLRALRQTEPAQ